MMIDYRKKLMALGFNLFWHRIRLSDGGSVEVCSPPCIQLSVQQQTSSSTQPTRLPDWAHECFPRNASIPQKIWVYLPFTKDEVWAQAKKEGAFPLTTAVADQVHCHKRTHSVSFTPWPKPKLQVRAAGGPNASAFWSYNFIGYGLILTKTKYRGLDRTKLVSGAHKLWILHNHSVKRINYGFYQESKSGGLGKYLGKSKWSTMQVPGPRHPGPTFWDYSQMMQLMRNYMNPDKTPGNLYHAIQDEKLALWDTTYGRMTKRVLDGLGLTSSQGMWR
jgi:hypothetical protein